MDFLIQFADITLNEAAGYYEDVKKIMTKEEPFCKNWVLRSNVIVSHQTGISNVIANFYHDGNVFIVDYYPSSKDIFNDDVRCFKAWCIEYGWKCPSPSENMIKTWPDFWKHQWETYIIDCDIFDKKYGKRNEPLFDDNEIEEPEEDEGIDLV